MFPEAERMIREQHIDPLPRTGWHVEPFRPELPVPSYDEAAVEGSNGTVVVLHLSNSLAENL